MFWRPDLDPKAIVLTPAPPSGGAPLFQPETWPGELHRREGEDGTFLILRVGPDEHHVFAPTCLHPGQPFGVWLPVGPEMAARSDAAARFWRRISGHGTPRAGAAPDPRLKRTRQSVRALDARDAGASYRELAEAIWGADRLADEDWRTSSLRDATIRLVQGGLALAHGGYCGLLGRKPAA